MKILDEVNEKLVGPSMYESTKLSDHVETIKIHKGPDVFGLSVNIVDSTGVKVTSVTPGSACDQDGRLKAEDVLVSVNDCSLVNADARVVGDVLRSVDKSTSDVIVQYIPSEKSETSMLDHFPILRRPLMKSEEEEDEYFDVPEMEPPDPNALSHPPTLISEVKNILPQKIQAVTELPKPPPPPDDGISTKIQPIESKISPIPLLPKPAITSPKPTLGMSPTTMTSTTTKLDVGSMVSKVKPTVPFKPIRTSLSPKDAFPVRVKSKATTIESVLGEKSTSNANRQWGPERIVELHRDPAKGLGISILHAAKMDTIRGGIFIKNVLSDSPAGWDGTLKRGDRILEVSGVDIRSANHSEAVTVIKNASNPVKFVIQSLVPLPKKTETETSPVTNTPSIFPLEVTVKEVTKSSDAIVLPPLSAQLPSVLSASTVSMDTSIPPSASSSSNESITKRASSPNQTTTPNVDASTTQATSSLINIPSEVSSDRPLITEDENVYIAEEGEDDQVSFETLAEGKVLSKKGKQIDMDSAANIKLTPPERASDSESEDEFGYTHNLA